MLFDDTYKSIKKSKEGYFKEKGSKFLAFSFPVQSEEEIKKQLSFIRKQHPSANHHCYAYVLGAEKLFFRANDDGEPSNTAGKPILAQIKSRDLTNLLVIVVRYFGGTLLGINGLINAYKLATIDALNNSEIIEHTVDDYYEIIFDYTALNELLKILKDEKVNISEQEFELNCKIVFSVRRSLSEKLESKIKKMAGVKIVYLRSG